MAITIRTVGFAGHQRVVTDVDVDGVTPDSIVVASICEESSSAVPFTGSARMYVANVVPLHGKVQVWSQIDWDHDLRVRVSMLIYNP